MWESVGTVSPIINLGIRRMSVVSFTIQSICPLEKNPKYPLNGRPYGSQSRYITFEDINLLPLLRIETRFLVRPGPGLIATQTELPAPKINSCQTFPHQKN